MQKHKNNTNKKPSRYHLAQLRHFKRIRALYEHNAATGIALLMPFVAILTVTLMYKLTLPETDSVAHFYGMWIFSAPVVVVWAVIFPTIAFVINLSSLTTIIRDHRYNGKIRPKALLADIWPSLTIVLVSLGLVTLLFGSGSVICNLSNSAGLGSLSSGLLGCP